jgi:CCR4-NOT transcription complex subunit 1
VLGETYANIRVLLQSDKTAAVASERSLLKNLGVWLGSITLARNRPILHKVRTPAATPRAPCALC